MTPYGEVMSDAANPSPEKSPIIADLLAQTLAAIANAPAEEKAEIMKEMAADHAAAAAAKKAAQKSEKGEEAFPMIPTFMKHVYLTVPPHQVVCSKCDHVVLAGEMATIKALVNGEPSFRHLRCMGVPIVK